MLALDHKHEEVSRDAISWIDLLCA